MEGTKVFIPWKGEIAWVPATVTDVQDDKFTVQPEQIEGQNEDAEGPPAGEALEVTLKDEGLEEFDALPLQNMDQPDDGCPDMCHLNYLHEPAILYNLRRRFNAVKPYTYTGEICIAVNPYQWIDIYTEELQNAYMERHRDELDPHAFGVSATAYNQLRANAKDQSILVSGESGAGKTETVKILMNHLAAVGGNNDDGVIKRVINSNPLLESFGNAKTVRNDNSSRFGKFTQLQFDTGAPVTELMGSRCEHYLLEKTRVIALSPGERSYHIFYQLIRSADTCKIEWGTELAGKSVEDFYYTAQGDLGTDVIEGTSDHDKFNITTDTLKLIGVDDADIMSLYKALSAILFLGLSKFTPSADGESSSVADPELIEQVSRLLEVAPDQLTLGLTTRTMRTRGEAIAVQLDPGKAVDARDALAKALYAKLFDWLVGAINASTSRKRDVAKEGIISLLDIFGFECFATNRFEQLCINFANEKLQQKFTQDVFKTVQIEYEEEGINWDHIEFPDNADMLELVEGKKGLIAVLNEECIRPGGDDEGFTSKLSKAHGDNKRFVKARMSKVEFTLKHYAGPVTYTTVGFVDKNKDALSDDLVDLVKASDSVLLQGLFMPKDVPETPKKASGPGKRRTNTETVTSKFKAQLGQLMTSIGATEVQYVRCIKPNRIKSCTAMNNLMVVEQLRCAGVIEAIRISRAGYPNRMLHGEFVGVYSMLAPSFDASAPSEQEKCVSLLAVLLPGRETEYQMGHTKVYFKTGLLELLEEQRGVALSSQAIRIQKLVRGYQQLRRFRIAKRCVLKLQALIRSTNAQRVFNKALADIIKAQNHMRKVAAKRRCEALRRNRACARIQAQQRRRVTQRIFQRKLSSAVRIQTRARTRMARMAYVVALAEFKENSKLENQLKMLQEQMAQQARAHQEEMERLAASAATEVVVEKQIVVETTRSSMTDADREKERELMDKSRDMIEYLRKEVTKLRSDNGRLKEQVSVLKSDKNSAQQFNATHKDMNSTNLSTQLQKYIKDNRVLKEANRNTEKALAKLEKQLKQKNEEIEYMQAIKRNQTESMIKQQQLMFSMVETARKMGASPELIAELQAQSSPDFGAALDEMDEEVERTRQAKRGSVMGNLSNFARGLF